MNNTESKDAGIYNPVGKELETYVYADAVITCSVCGTDNKVNHPLYKNVETGIQLPFLQTNNDNVVGLACEECAKQGKTTALTFRFKDAEKPPAYGFSHEGYDLPTEFKLSWIGRDSVKEYKVYLAKEGESSPEGSKIQYDIIDTVTSPSCNLKLEEVSDYRLKIESIYGDVEEGDTQMSRSINISTKSAPSNSNEIEETTKEGSLEDPKVEK